MAINFPDSPSVNDQHTSAGVTWTWDGTTWKADGVTASYSLPIATSNALGGIKVGTNLSINSSTGVLSADASAITVQEEGTSLNVAATTLNFVGSSVTATGTGSTKTITVSDSATYSQQLTVANATPAAVQWDLVPSVGVADSITITAGNNITFTAATADTFTINAAAGSGLQSRATGSATATGLASGAAANITIVAAKSYILQKIQTSHAAWVTVYTDSTARTNDASRTESTDPLPGTGVIAEVITSDGATQPITPGTIGWNNEVTPTTNAYVKVVNKSGGTQDVAVTLHFVAVEA